ncbi:MAG: undecaprenyl-diphosphate phosphatase [Planctomycetota bacterium]
MNLLKVILLGIVQGLTEFLPVSSSGHLVAAGALLDVSSPGVLLEVSLHFGTLLAILAVFRRDLAELIRGGWAGTKLLLAGRGDEIRSEAPAFYTCVALAIGTIPAGLAGTMLEDYIKPLFKGNLAAAGGFLVFTGLLLATTRYAPRGSDSRAGVGKGLGIGLAQALALLPGVSRSGVTIAAGLHLNLERETAARFAFLLAVPALVGAQAWELLGGAGANLSGGSWLTLAAGTAVSALVGAGALLMLMPLVRRGKLHLFAYYCIPAGLVMVGLGLLG